jgi:thioredoxin 1
MADMKSFTELINSEKPVLVDFTATWCGPCKMMAPILQQVKRNMGDNITIVKIDIDKSPQTAQTFAVQSVPTLILFRKGNVQWRQSGVIPASQLEEVLTRFLG